MSQLLTRDAFREGVFKRDGHRCVICGAPAVRLSMAKFVRAGHVQTAKHWMHGQRVVPNHLAPGLSAF